jgi:hypothetical protein
MLGSSWAAAQLTAPQEGLSSMRVSCHFWITCMTTVKRSSVYLYRYNLMRKPLDARNRLKERQLKNIPPYICKGEKWTLFTYCGAGHVPAVAICWLLRHTVGTVGTNCCCVSQFLCLMFLLLWQRSKHLAWYSFWDPFDEVLRDG